MALNVTPKAASANSNTPSAVISRKEVSIARPTSSTSRAEALKKRLMGTTLNQPMAPRPAGSSARQEEMAKLNKFTAPTPQVPPQAKAQPAKTSARAVEGDLASIAPPPSGLAHGQEVIKPNNSVETPQQATEASSEPMSPQFVALARKERQLRKAQQEFKAAQDVWKQDQANYIPKSRLSSETLKVLAEVGITPDKLVELQINQAADQDPQQALLNRISDLENKLKGFTDPENGEFAQRDKAAYEQAVSQIRSDVKLLVDSNPEFGTIKSEGKTNDVVELITQVFDEEGTILDVEEAAGLVENKLTERLVKQYERLSQYEKIKAKIGKSAEPKEAIKAQPTQQSKPVVNTLTNAGAIQRPLSPRDRAVLKVQEALNSRKGK